MTLYEHPAVKLLTQLLAVPAPSGREERMAAKIQELVANIGYESAVDPAGNVLVRIAGRCDSPLCCLAAHMDEIGMVVTHIEDNGDLRVDRSGGLYPWKLGEGPVDIIADDHILPGLLSMGSTHTSSAGTRAVEWEDVRVVTGLSPDALAHAGVRPGSSAVPSASRRGPVLLGEQDDPLLAAWTFDDRLGVVTLIRLLEFLKTENIAPAFPLLVAFTVHEEGGGHGAKVLAHRERPELFISVDGCPIPPGAPIAMDDRPGIWSKDRLAHYDQRLIHDLQKAARSAGTELQSVVYQNAASDASLVYSTGAVPRIACCGHVRANSHGFEIIRLAVADNLLQTFSAFVMADLSI